MKKIFSSCYVFKAVDVRLTLIWNCSKDLVLENLIEQQMDDLEIDKMKGAVYNLK